MRQQQEQAQHTERKGDIAPHLPQRSRSGDAPDRHGHARRESVSKFRIIMDQIRDYATFTNSSDSWHVPAFGRNVYSVESQDPRTGVRSPNLAKAETLDMLFSLSNAIRGLEGKAPYEFEPYRKVADLKAQGSGRAAHINPDFYDIVRKGDGQTPDQFSLLVSPEVGFAVESKNALAAATQFFTDPNTSEQAQRYVETYLERRGVNGQRNKQTAGKVLSILRASTMASSVFNTENAFNTAAERLAHSGIVMKINKSCSGDGVVILTPEDLRDLNVYNASATKRKTPFELACERYSAKWGGASIETVKASILNSGTGSTWQQFVNTGLEKLEGSVQFWVQPEQIQQRTGSPILCPYATTKQTAVNGVHRGNAVRSAEHGLAALFDGDLERASSFNWGTEILVDWILKNTPKKDGPGSAFPEGLHDPKAVLRLFSMDVLFRGGIMQNPVACEFNARPSFVTRILKQIGELVNVLERGGTVLSLNSDTQKSVPELVKCIEKLGVDHVAKLFRDTCLQPAKKLHGHFDTFQIGLYPDKRGTLVPSIYTVCVFPNYDPKKDKEYLAAMDEVGKNVRDVLSQAVGKDLAVHTALRERSLTDRQLESSRIARQQIVTGVDQDFAGRLSKHILTAQHHQIPEEKVATGARFRLPPRTPASNYTQREADRAARAADKPANPACLTA